MWVCPLSFERMIVMTDKEKTDITDMRRKGVSYTKIAQTLHLPTSTVKSYCVRNKLASQDTQNSCLQCGAILQPSAVKREKKFCSDVCRIKWWNHHTSLMKENTVCSHCGKSFHGRAGRKFCSHSCYIAERFGEKDAE